MTEEAVGLGLRLWSWFPVTATPLEEFILSRLTHSNNTYLLYLSSKKGSLVILSGRIMPIVGSALDILPSSCWFSGSCCKSNQYGTYKGTPGTPGWSVW